MRRVGSRLPEHVCMHWTLELVLSADLRLHGRQQSHEMVYKVRVTITFINSSAVDAMQ